MWHGWIFAPSVESVSEVLENLPDEYVVLKDLVLPEGRITFDYVVAGPSGLFAVETKDWTGEVKCKGHDWFVGRKRVPSPGRPAQIKAAALRKTLVHLIYDGERTVPAVAAVLTFTDPEVSISVSAPAVPAMRLEELPSFIVHYKTSEVDESVRAGIVGHLVSFPSRPKLRRRRFFGMKARSERRAVA
jgi:Nuclease-related domain